MSQEDLKELAKRLGVDVKKLRPPVKEDSTVTTVKFCGTCGQPRKKEVNE